MSRRDASRLAWSLGGVYLVLLALIETLVLLAEDFDSFNAIVPAILLAYPTIGAVIVGRQPGNPIGWLFIAVALFEGVTALTDTYARASGAASLPGPEWAAWVSAWIWIPSLFLAGTFLLLLFPTGSFLFPRWRVVAWLAVAGMILFAIGQAFRDGRISSGFENPLAASDGAAEAVAAAEVAGGVIWIATVLASAASLILRTRRARGVERQQIKWFAYAAALMAVGLAISGVGQFTTSVVDDVGWNLFLFGFALAMPVCAGIAILKYRLYEIDRIVNRTVVYGILSALLAGLYFGIVLALQEVFSSFAGGSDLAIAVSTLAVAALFRPARGWIQGAVDRRFYRRRYDAQRTLEAFSARLREEIDLDSLDTELRAVVQETMQPSHISFWIRAPFETVTRAVTIPGRSPGTKELR